MTSPLPPDPVADLHLRQITLRLGHWPLLELDQVVRAGDILTVMGPSGSGKSSLLAYLAGCLPSAFSASGEVWLGTDRLDRLAPEQRGLGLLFQDPLLFPHLSVAGNLRFALPASCRDKPQQIAAALAQVGLAGFESRDPATLSGGQQSRVALMRLLLSRPRAVLLDEPFSKLDSARRQEMRTLVFKHLKQARLPAVLVTHDPDDAEAAGGEAVTLD